METLAVLMGAFTVGMALGFGGFLLFDHVQELQSRLTDAEQQVSEARADRNKAESLALALQDDVKRMKAIESAREELHQRDADTIRAKSASQVRSMFHGMQS